MLAEALGYASAGWPIFPLRGKQPLTRHGFKEATVDHDQIYAWWHKWPHANIGFAILPGLMVIDIDPRAGGSTNLAELTSEHGPIPATLTAISGRGDGGCHYYLVRPPGMLTTTRLPRGVDYREGGKHYVVAPPSIHPDTGRPYRWANNHDIALPPQWLTDLLRAPIVPPAPPAPRGNADGSELVRFVTGLQEGNRNHGFYWACCKAVTEGAWPVVRHDLRQAALSIGLTEREVDATMRSAARTIGGAA